MIYTSYFGQLKRIKSMENLHPISIARFAPKFYQGDRFLALAPTPEMLKMDYIPYTQAFFQLLSTQSPEVVASKLADLAKGKTPVILCYEVYGPETADAQKTLSTAEQIGVIGSLKPKEFCHRHFVARWFEKHGIECRELSADLV